MLHAACCSLASRLQPLLREAAADEGAALLPLPPKAWWKNSSHVVQKRQLPAFDPTREPHACTRTRMKKHTHTWAHQYARARALAR
jgi:hypothetical protein